ncbi:branched-chain amino acid ABC transporter permease [Thalassobaculum fulvum]|jgi:branched-chain amino acid transport system permease protein/neutral amino acid transport system permease protein|uniref:Branched-chain amino acid ABC transporter permease n=1 Tax=Thalassobaculum fulvum TaxID=1633335 RepID=A0A919CRV2_9PROT|nr:branched-chain amino acid ABC transporter permease [Thalassobaculum fulvum]GHD55323.1 branched-chain amino acid ABC transporter permease [Thalassobaculum fulvum]
MLTEVVQLVLNGLMAGTILAVPAIGFTAIYAVLRFPNFSVASQVTIGAFAGYVANVTFGLPAPVAVAFAFLVAGFSGLVCDEFVLRPMRPAGPLAAAIAAVALTIVLENVVRFWFGNDLRGYDLPVLRDWRFAGLRVSPQQLENGVIAIIAMACLFGFLAFSRMGKAMRAVADNPMLASIKGIDSVAVGRLVSFVGMGLAGLGGMLLGLDTSIDPLTGFRAILTVFAAAVVGGLGSIPGAVVGALTIGVAEELSLLVLDPAYRSAVGFVAILLVLTLRPRGILGERAF